MKKIKPTNLLTVISFVLLVFLTQSCKQALEIDGYPLLVKEIDSDAAAELAKKIRSEVAVEITDDLELSLWAADTLINDPIAISIDDNGRIFYTSATRLENSEFDIRGHTNWMTASISFQTVEDRRAFLRKTFSEQNEEGEQFLKDLNEDGTLDWKDLTVEKEQIWFVEDKSGNGVAERAQLYLEDFHEEITDLANGIEYHDGEVYISVGPDLWKTKDVDGDGISDQKESLSHGFAVHIGFGAHGMSGAKIGPDGRIWWGIGDIGMNVIDKEGKQWKYPNQGVIVRSALDGSNFEVYSAGLRNTHEFVWDEYGNLITEDNDGDHAGERERLVYLINGSDCGWRINWQFGKYTDPTNNGYKVWMDEKMSIPRWEGQAAYILPPIMNYVNGPTGMVYNPGTALSEKWYNHFFISEFRGSPANSPIHAFTLQPNGAGFELDKTQVVVKGLLTTGLDFGPDGALYFGDWIDGWGTKDEGRIWKLDDPVAVNSAIRKETKNLIQSNFGEKEIAELSDLLKHQDMRIRQKAQFELAKRGNSAALLAAAKQTEYQLARVHGLWGLGQIARKNGEIAKNFASFLTDKDSEIIAQAAKMIGDVRYQADGDKLLPLLKNPSLRVQMIATEALGRLEHKAATQPIIDMLIANNDVDTWIRHAGMIALGRIGDETVLAALANHESKAARIAAVVALRRMQSPKIANFLQDKEEYIVAEVARGINDDWSIEAALPQLAEVLKETRFTNEALLRRAINAALRVGTPESLKLLADYMINKKAPIAMRSEAIEALSTWSNLSVFDRVDGRYRGIITRNDANLKTVIEPLLAQLLEEKQAAIQVATIKLIKRLELKEATLTLLAALKNNKSVQVRKTALQAYYELEGENIENALEIALDDKNNEVRSVALEILPNTKLEETTAVRLFQQILKVGTIEEKQAVIKSLGTLKGEAAINALANLMADVGTRLEPEIWLDVIEVVENQDNKRLKELLAAYQAKKRADDPLSPYIETLNGGNIKKGQNIFYGNPAGQCVRCHAIFEYGGNAGPGLQGVSNRLSKRELLEALVVPSAKYSKGYEVVTLALKDGESVTGIVSDESATEITLKIGKEDIQKIAKNRVKERKSVPSSMPVMKDILTKRELRDLVAFLGSLVEE